MGRYFHVDRSSTLRAGQTLALERPWDIERDRIPDQALQSHIEDLFPDGLTHHGLGYLFWQNGCTPEEQNNQAIDLVFELVRRAHFPDRPSRYQSIFGWDSFEAADAFRLVAGGGTIWEVEGECAFKADMNLLHLGTPLQASYRAHTYWAGAAQPDAPAQWECFLSPGAQILGVAIARP